MSEVDEVKSKLNIVDVIGERVTLKKAGRNFKGLCPFHNEKTPSFMVSPDRQVFHCFGCGKGGSVIDFVMEYYHMDFVEALEQLAGRAGVVLTKRMGDTPEQKLKEKLYEVNSLASEYYHYILTRHTLGEKALLYLKNRGISDKSIDTFSLGYSPNSWEGLYAFLKKKKYDDKLIETSGLAIRGNHGLYDRFRGRVMFTLKDHRGRVVGFAGRVLDKTVKDAKYINTSETPVYVKSNVLYGLDVTKDAIAKANEAIVMEGEIDVISSFQAGVSNVVAIKGSAITEQHVNLLKRFTERITFCLDSDMAGDAANRRGIDIGELAGMDMRVIILPSGKDPDEAARTDPVAFKKAVKNAIPIYDYFLDSVKKRFDLGSAYGKRKASDELLPVVSMIKNPIVQSHYIKKIAEVFDIGQDAVLAGMKTQKKSLQYVASLPQNKTSEAEELTRQEKMEVYLLSLLVQGDVKELFKEIDAVNIVGDLKHIGVRRIIEKLNEYLLGHATFTIQAFIESLPKELVPVVDRAYLYDIGDLLENQTDFKAEWTKTVKDLQSLIIREKIKKLSIASKTDEDEDIQGQITALARQLQGLQK